MPPAGVYCVYPFWSAEMPASTMLSGVAESASPISRWTLFLPSASSLRARASTSNAPSVPSRVMRSANLMVTLRMLSNSIPPVLRKRCPSPAREAHVWAKTGGIQRSVDARQLAAVDADRLAGDEARLLGAQER